jgi:hypothetical protein
MEEETGKGSEGESLEEERWRKWEEELEKKTE